MKRWTRHVGLVLGLAGIVLIGRGLFDLLAGRIFEIRYGTELNRSLRDAPPKARAATTARRSPYQLGTMIGRLEIPRIGLSTIAVEGDDAAELRVGAGRVPESRLPGEGGNLVFAGHRDTVFRPLRQVRPGDHIALRTPEGTYRYVVEWSRVVQPSELGVLGPTAQPVLTLVTCFPFDYIGAAPDRFIVRAKLDENTPMSPPADQVETVRLDRDPVPPVRKVAPVVSRRASRPVAVKPAAPASKSTAESIPAAAPAPEKPPIHMVATSDPPPSPPFELVLTSNPDDDSAAALATPVPAKRSRFARLDPRGLFHKLAHAVRPKKGQ